MSNNNVWTEITNSFASNQLEQRRFKYFRWKHKIDTDSYKYSEMTREEFAKTFDITDIEMINLVKWESSMRYKRLTLLLYEDGFTNDLIEIYDEIKKNALNGEHQSIKSLLSLQEEIRTHRTSIEGLNNGVGSIGIDEDDEEDDEFDGLELDIKI